MYFMVKSCIHTVWRPELHQNMPYLSPYHRPVPNSAKFRENIEILRNGQIRSSAQNSAFRGKLCSLEIRNWWAQLHGSCFVFTHKVAAQRFPAWNNVMATILELWCQIKKSDSVSGYIFTWRTLLPNLVPVWFETREPQAFWRGRPNKNRNKNIKISSDMRSVSDLRTVCQCLVVDVCPCMCMYVYMYLYVFCDNGCSVSVYVCLCHC